MLVGLVLFGFVPKLLRLRVTVCPAEITLLPKETLNTCAVTEQVDDTDVAPEVYRHCGLYPLTVVI